MLLNPSAPFGCPCAEAKSLQSQQRRLTCTFPRLRQTGGQHRLQDGAARSIVRFGSWLCENAKALDGDRRTSSSEIGFGPQTCKRAQLKKRTEECNSRLASIFRVFAQPGSFAAEPAGPACYFMSALPESDLIVTPSEMTRWAKRRRSASGSPRIEWPVGDFASCHHQT
jgi:hypothetical protein